MAESSNTEGEERGLLNVCLCQRKESSREKREVS
jgi:hypothetical protein